MKIFNKVSVVTLVVALVVSFVFGLTGPSPAVAATAVNLGTADSFAVLAGSFITATTPSVVSGDVGLSPAAGTFYTGLTTGQVAGTIYAVDATGPAGAAGNNPGLVNGAKTALDTAYIAAGQVTTGVISADLGSQTLTPGVYDDNDAPDSLGITGTLTLNAQGDPNAVFIFKTGSTLTTAANSHVTLINGAQACNVFWQVGSSATFGTGSDFKGNILAAASITDNGGSTIEGRLLARTAAVTLNNTHVTKATCALPPGSPSVTETRGGGMPPLINLVKTPNPLTLPMGGGSVTYTYKVKNIGTIPLNQVVLIDNKCDSQNMKFISSDGNSSLTAVDSQSWLAVNETWTYSCATNLTQTTKNTATVTGYANDLRAADIAVATVVVGVPLPPPLIHLVKKPNVFVLPAPGGAVTYTYTVTNPGTAPLSDVSVIDDKCTGLPGRVFGHPGDSNKNNLLESNEAWSFTCQTNLTQTTTNTGTAEGSANGLTAIDFSPATVIVSAPTPSQVLGATTPGLPNTGLPPEEKSTPWNIVILAGIFAVSIFFYFARRKQII